MFLHRARKQEYEENMQTEKSLGGPKHFALSQQGWVLKHCSMVISFLFTINQQDYCDKVSFVNSKSTCCELNGPARLIQFIVWFNSITFLMCRKYHLSLDGDCSCAITFPIFIIIHSLTFFLTHHASNTFILFLKLHSVS